MKTIAKERKRENHIAAPRDVVDQVTYDPRRGEYDLYLIERDVPDNPEEYPRLLQEKLLRYLNYVLSGDMAMAYPESILKPVRFRFVYLDEVNEEIAHFMDLVSSLLRSLDIPFDIRVFSDTSCNMPGDLSAVSGPVELKM